MKPTLEASVFQPRAESVQHTATRRNTLQHAAPHCNTPQHTATRRNTLQHAATQSAQRLEKRQIFFLPRAESLIAVC